MQTDDEMAREMACQLMTVAEALRPSMARVSDLLVDAAELIKHLGYELERAFTVDR